jgi:hypothetical protein
LEAIAPSGRMWQGTESRCSSKQATTVCPARGSGGLLASRRQRNGNRWRTASQTPLSGSQAQMMRSRGPEKEFLDLCTETLHASVSSSLSWKQHRSSLDTKSHRAPHEAYEARANAHLWTPPAGLAYTFLTPSLPGHPSARDAAKKKSYAHAVSRSFAYETRRHHPGSVLRRAVSAVLEERLTIFLVSFYYRLQHTQLSGTTRGIRLRSPLYLQRSISTPELILLCEIANSQPFPKLRAQLVAFRQHSLS